jgi:hypothetical protein
MISRITAKNISLIFGPGDRYHVFRFHLRTSPNYSLELRTDSRVWGTVSSICILIMSMLVSFLIYQICFGPLKKAERLFSAGIGSPIVFGLVSQLFLHCYSKQIVTSVNGSFALTRNVGECFTTSLT